MTSTTSALGIWGMRALVLGITIISGMADAQGFLYAALIWEHGTLSLGALARSVAGFTVGITLYYLGLKVQMALGIRSPELQATSWFAVTLIGVAVTTGRFATWRLADQIVAVLVLAGIGWLMFRVAV